MGNMKGNFTILFASAYSFVQSNGANKGEKVEGLNISYIADDDLSPSEDREAGTFGIEVVSDNIPYSELPNLKSVPGVYECSFSMKNVKVKKNDVQLTIPRVKVTSIKFVRDFASLVPSKV